MRCELCKKTVHINYGNAHHVFCKECSSKDVAQQIMKNNKGPAEEKTEAIEIPFITTIIAIVFTIAAFSLILLLSNQLLKYFDGQFIFIGITAILLILLVRDIAKHKYYIKLINNDIIAQSLKSKLNIELFCGLVLLAASIISLLLIGNQIRELYDYLMQERYIQNINQMFNPEFMTKLKNYAYNSENVKLLLSINQAQDRLASLLYCAVLFVFGLSQLYKGMHTDTISGIGILIRGKILNWKEFASYSWGKCYEKQTFNNSSGYYDLVLAHKNGKVLTYFLKKNESPVILKIRAEDKDKVDKFLLSVLPKKTD